MAISSTQIIQTVRFIQLTNPKQLLLTLLDGQGAENEFITVGCTRRTFVHRYYDGAMSPSISARCFRGILSTEPVIQADSNSCRTARSVTKLLFEPQCLLLGSFPR